jgi:hypothetical protein
MSKSGPTGGASAAGYSGTPLAKKLGIKSGGRVCTIAAPPEYVRWLAPLPPDATIGTKAPKAGCAIVHLFVRTLAEFERDLPRARRLIVPDGAIRVSWPKKSSRIPSDLSEDAVRARALKTDLVDIKVCAVTDIWSGLKLVVRKHLRPRAVRVVTGSRPEKPKT